MLGIMISGLSLLEAGACIYIFGTSMGGAYFFLIPSKLLFLGKVFEEQQARHALPRHIEGVEN